MDSVYFEGEQFTLRNGIWYDDSFIAAPKTLQLKLNTLLSKNTNYTELPLDDVIKAADGFKKCEIYNLAIDAYRQALKRSNVKHAKSILPRVTSWFAIYK